MIEELQYIDLSDGSAEVSLLSGCSGLGERRGPAGCGWRPGQSVLHVSVHVVRVETAVAARSSHSRSAPVAP